MFLHELSSEQRRAFLALAHQVIDADRRLAMQEVERLDRLYAEAGLDAGRAGVPPGAADLPLLFPTERSRVAVLLDLLLVGYADGTLETREEQAIRDVAARLYVDAGTWEAALDWARRYQELIEEARALGHGPTADASGSHDPLAEARRPPERPVLRPRHP